MAPERDLYEGKYLRLVEDNGWEFVDRRNVTGIVVVVAVTDANEVILIEQHRKPVRGAVIELPAGLAGDIPGEEHEDLATAAARELEEETGYAAESFEFLTEGPVSPGQSTEVITLFRARGLKKTGAGGGDESEDIAVHLVPLDEAAAWLEARRGEGAQVDPKVYAGLFFAAAGTES